MDIEVGKTYSGDELEKLGFKVERLVAVGDDKGRIVVGRDVGNDNYEIILLSWSLGEAVLGA